MPKFQGIYLLARSKIVHTVIKILLVHCTSLLFTSHCDETIKLLTEKYQLEHTMGQ